DARFAGLSTTGVPMSFLRLTIILAALTSVAVPMTSAAQEAVRTNEPVIETGDVDRFYALYDAADGRPTAEQLQAYLDGGSEGLRHLARIRNVTGERMAGALEARPEMYAEARECAALLPQVRERVTV